MLHIHIVEIYMGDVLYIIIVYNYQILVDLQDNSAVKRYDPLNQSAFDNCINVQMIIRWNTLLTSIRQP